MTRDLTADARAACEAAGLLAPRIPAADPARWSWRSRAAGGSPAVDDAVVAQGFNGRSAAARLVDRDRGRRHA